MTDIVMARPRAEVTVMVKSYLGPEGKYIKFNEGTEPTITFTSLSSVLWRVDAGINVYNALDQNGANNGFIISPNRYTGRIRILITDPDSLIRARELVDTWAITDVTIVPNTEDSRIVLRDTIFESENVDITSAMTNVPVVDFDIAALTVDIYSGATLVGSYGDGWENVAGGIQGGSEDNSAW